MARGAPSIRCGRFVSSLVLLSGTLACGTAGLLGCVQRGNYPEIPTSMGFAESPNKPATMQAITAALQYVGSRWTPGQRMMDPSLPPRAQPSMGYPAVINMPFGTRRVFYERVAREVGPGVVPATPETVASGLPVFHVSRAWMRFNRAQIDVLRPVPELGPGPDGGPIFQKITLHLSGGTQPWTVEYARSWNPGDDRAPAYFFMPATDNPNQYEVSLRELRGPGEAAPAMAPAPESAPATLTGVVEGDADAGVPATDTPQ